MNKRFTVADVAEALRTKAEEYRKRLLDLRQALRDEGRDAVDPGHSAGADSIKFEIACIEQLLAALPTSESVKRIVVCEDPESDENVVFAIITKGRGGGCVQIGTTKVQFLSPDAPAAASLLNCRVGDDTPLGRIVSLDCSDE